MADGNHPGNVWMQQPRELGTFIRELNLDLAFRGNDQAEDNEQGVEDQGGDELIDVDGEIEAGEEPGAAAGEGGERINDDDDPVQEFMGNRVGENGMLIDINQLVVGQNRDQLVPQPTLETVLNRVVALKPNLAKFWHDILCILLRFLEQSPKWREELVKTERGINELYSTVSNIEADLRTNTANLHPDRFNAHTTKLNGIDWAFKKMIENVKSITQNTYKIR